MKAVRTVGCVAGFMALSGVFLDPFVGAATDQIRVPQAMVEARIVTILEADEREIGFEMLGSTWGRSQPKPGEHVWDGTDDAFSFLIAKSDAPFFQRAVDEALVFSRWRIVLRDGNRRRDCELAAPRITAVRDRSMAVLIVGAGSVSCAK